MGWKMPRQSGWQALQFSNALAVSSTGALVTMTILLGPMLEVAWANNGDSVPSSSRFTCEVQNGEYTVVYRPKSTPNQAYPWAVPTELGGGWTPQRRCETISARLEEYRPDRLVELRTDVENGYNTVCATTEENLDSCRIVFTVPPGQDPIATRDAVFSNITLADAGTDTSAVNTFVGTTRLPGSDLFRLGSRNNSINDVLGEVLMGQPAPGHRSYRGIYLKPFLDPVDGGTGDYL